MYSLCSICIPLCYFICVFINNVIHIINIYLVVLFQTFELVINPVKFVPFFTFSFRSTQFIAAIHCTHRNTVMLIDNIRFFKKGFFRFQNFHHKYLQRQILPKDIKKEFSYYDIKNCDRKG